MKQLAEAIRETDAPLFGGDSDGLPLLPASGEGDGAGHGREGDAASLPPTPPAPRDLSGGSVREDLLLALSEVSEGEWQSWRAVVRCVLSLDPLTSPQKLANVARRLEYEKRIAAAMMEGVRCVKLLPRYVPAEVEDTEMGGSDDLSADELQDAEGLSTDRIRANRDLLREIGRDWKRGGGYAGLERILRGIEKHIGQPVERSNPGLLAWLEIRQMEAERQEGASA